MTAEGTFFKAREWANFALDMIFPKVCAGCGQLGDLICFRCYQQFHIPQPPWCYRCGQSLSNPSPDCKQCKTKKSLQQVRAAFIYKDPLAEIIQKMKYDSLFALAEPLGEFMADKWPDWDHDPDIIIPIPLHPRRRRRRGFNQAALLAQPLGNLFGLAIDEASLRRIRYTAPQVGLNAIERKRNVTGAFVAKAGHISGKNILLVDDLYTTGATMSTAADVLKAAGAGNVSAYCLARTD